MAALSSTPLVKKLGIKSHTTILLLNQPQNYLHLVAPLPEDVTITEQLDNTPYDLIHFFTSDSHELERRCKELKCLLKTNGSLWISWPKKASGGQTNLDEHIVRETGLKEGLVDVKVCAIDDTWSGLKFVHRVQNRS